MSKLERLANEYGFEDVMDMLESAVMDCVCPAICMNPGCNYTTDMEPDQGHGWCEECGTNTVKSALRIAGII